MAVGRTDNLISHRCSFNLSVCCFFSFCLIALTRCICHCDSLMRLIKFTLFVYSMLVTRYQYLKGLSYIVQSDLENLYYRELKNVCGPPLK